MHRTWVTAALLAIAACGGGNDTPSTDAPAAIDAATDSGAAIDAGSDGRPVSGRLLPLAVGNTWTYDVTPAGGAAVAKTSTVQAFEDIGGDKAGIMAYRVRTEKIDGATVSWQADTGTAVVRHREQVFDLTATMTSEQYYNPSKLRVDDAPAHTAQGATWTDAYTELTRNVATNVVTTIPKSETWTVEATAESVTVPAGTFLCIRLHRTGAAGAADKRYWFSPGVGKIKEVDVASTEELRSYTLH